MTTKQIALKLSNILEERAKSLARAAFNLKPTETTGTNARLFIESYFPKADVVLLDSRYKVLSWDKWQEIIEWDKNDLTKYVKQFWDCDDFAYTFKYSILKNLGIPCFVVHGHLYNKDGKWIVGHFWNAMIADGKLYFYEPIYDRWVEVIKGQKILIKMAQEEREYRPITFEF